MSLSRIEILGFRGFSERGSLDLAVPTGKSGSGLTILTGPNNAGKSSILECLRARLSNVPTSFGAGKRNASTERVEIKYFVNGKEETVTSIAKGSSETFSHGVDETFQVFAVPSRRAFNPYFHKGEVTRDQYQRSVGLPPQRSSILANFEYRLFNIVKSPAKFNALLGEALGYVPEWTIDQSEQGQYFLKFFNGKNSHSSDGMGEGIVSLFSIVDALYDSVPGNVIVVDEPELSLHPSLQKRIAGLLRRFSEDRQIVVCTHSPYFVDLPSLANGGHLARVTTTHAGTQIHQLSKEAKDAIGKLSNGNIFNPHVFGLDARELFFQEDRIILTEGQEDVLMYPLVAQQLGVEITGNFFGWGVGGASNISRLCLILKDLGFQKIAGLLDGDQEAEVIRLRKEYPTFYFGCIPTKDIRTKPARQAIAEVPGLLDNDKKIRAEFEEPLRLMLNSMSSQLKS